MKNMVLLCFKRLSAISTEKGILELSLCLVVRPTCTKVCPLSPVVDVIANINVIFHIVIFLRSSEQRIANQTQNLVNEG